MCLNSMWNKSLIFFFSFITDAELDFKLKDFIYH